MGRRILIDPVTRLEGHGRIDIILGDDGNVKRAGFRVPDFKGFEKFCEGRAGEEMPALTQKICGVCPTAHNIASTKALDTIFNATPPKAGKMLRELMHNAFVFEDHMLHFYYLGGPDLIPGLGGKKEARNFMGMFRDLGRDIGKKVVEIRKQVRAVNAMISGSALYPACGLAGGVPKPISGHDAEIAKRTAEKAVEFALLTLKIFHENIFENKKYKELFNKDFFIHKTYYMGLVDNDNRVNFYEGKIRIVDPDGYEIEKIEADDYIHIIKEKVVPDSYMKNLYLAKIGWNGLTDGKKSGIYRVGPLARLNVADKMATELAQKEYEKMFYKIGPKPVHNTLAYHWARLIEALYAAERMVQLTSDPMITEKKVRNLGGTLKKKGIGVCEAPRGTLIHDYETDDNAIIRKVKMIVATQNNAAAICMSVEKAAKGLIRKGHATKDILNRVEMAYRAYDPCLACATH